ncbi:MAG: 3-dehydroquinate synthase [Candidatus Omnitrophica bacterium]|nr:3-dehydroquinate synthase [Candidatus Omnitrophota bacterium]
MTANIPQSEITVGLGERSYVITVRPGLIDRVGSYAQSLGFHSPVPIITDDTVAELYGGRVKNSLEQAGFETAVLSFPAGEASKHLQTVSRLYDGLVALKPERKSGLIALGGGVPGDVAGFAAATYLRGIPFIQVPTTLLADVDSSVGGKVGVDHPGGKNLIGAFHQPKAVLIDTDALQTLDPRQIRAGLAEIIKHGVIADSDLFQTVRSNLDLLLKADGYVCGRIIPWNCRIKAGVVERDERESGLRAILNFGHTFGHAVESLTGYQTYLHGEAVALGMLLEAQLGQKMGLTPAPVVDGIRDILVQARYPLQKPGLSAEALLDGMLRDKKVEKGALRFVLPVEMGKVVVQAVTDLNVIRETWNNYNGLE